MKRKILFPDKNKNKNKECRKPKKSLGQHFLRDQKIQDRITNDFKGVAKAIIEVGPGQGALTKGLAALAVTYLVVEKDLSLIEYLKKYVTDEQIIIADALEIDWNKFIEEKNLQSVWLVSNLPYNISAPLFVKFLKSSHIKYMTLMFQLEVGEKILGSGEMNRLHGLSSPYLDIKVLNHVSKNSFWPKPKVESIVLSMVRREEGCEQSQMPLLPLKEIDSYENFLRELFKYKRKQILTVLKSFNSSVDLVALLNELQLDHRMRAEDLDLKQVISLYKGYKNLCQ
ncbi:MAG: ribosomal RNA small subunit methyltransferase A [Oligoflexia bacterium]|nr:ribosomal RNA small subunit methyltransferase A [Oligoflexia bacterium]